MEAGKRASGQGRGRVGRQTPKQRKGVAGEIGFALGGRQGDMMGVGEAENEWKWHALRSVRSAEQTRAVYRLLDLGNVCAVLCGVAGAR